MLRLLKFLFFIKVKNIVFVKNTAVNIEQKIPTLSVVANPFIGPEPIKKSIIAANKVVILASIIAVLDFI